MKKINLQLAALIMLIFTKNTKCTEIELSSPSPSCLNLAQTTKDAQPTNEIRTEATELKVKICAVLTALKRTLNKLESILAETNLADCCEDNNQENDEDEDDDCPSLDFDDCTNCCDDDCDQNANQDDSCTLANLPVNLNINCNDNQKVKIHLKVQTCKKLKQTVSK